MNKRYLTSKELVVLYTPLFTKRNITTAIISKNLPYIKMGIKRYFDMESIERWLQEQQKLSRKMDYTTLSDLRVSKCR